MAFHANKEISVNSKDDNAKISNKAIQPEKHKQKLSKTLELEDSPDEVVCNYSYDDCESIKGRFSWIKIAGYCVPIITRIINHNHFEFVSVRIVETKLLKHYLHNLHVNAYNYVSVKSHFITSFEAKLLNEINFDCNGMFGEDMFIAGKDCIVLLKDFQEFYTFLKFCYDKLTTKNPNDDTICGCIRVKNRFIIPYVIVNGEKYVPRFYFESSIKEEMNLLKLKKWNLAYLKFIFVFQNLEEGLITDDFCIAVKLDDIKVEYPLSIRFNECWPLDMSFAKHLLTNYPNYPSCAWIRVSPKIPTPEKKRILPEPVTQPRMPVTMNAHQKELTENQTSSTIKISPQGSSSMNSVCQIIPPSLIVHAGSNSPVVRSNRQLRDVQASSNDWLNAGPSQSRHPIKRLQRPKKLILQHHLTSCKNYRHHK